MSRSLFDFKLKNCVCQLLCERLCCGDVVMEVEVGFSRMFSPSISIVLRGVIYTGILLVALLLCVVGNVYVGIKPFLLQDFVSSLGCIGGLSVLITALTLFLAIIIPFLVLMSRNGLIMGYIRTTMISAIILVLIVLGITWYHVYREGVPTTQDTIATIMLLSTLIALVILDRKYPYIAVKAETARLPKDYLAIIKVYGDVNGFEIHPVPVDSFSVRGPFKTLYAHYYELHYIAGKSSSITMKYRDIEIGRINISGAQLPLRRIRFKAFVNDDDIGVYEYTIEAFKSLDIASRPVVRAVAAKIGIEIDQIHEIMFFDSNGTPLDPRTLIKELDIDEVQVKIYFTEPYMEILKYYRKESIINLWDKLMKRLEIYGDLVDDLAGNLDKALVKLISLSVNWW